MENTPNTERRDFIRKAAYASPILLTLSARPAFATPPTPPTQTSRALVSIFPARESTE